MLVYNKDSLGNTIPDFSGVGYMQGNQQIPNVAVVKTVSPDGINDQALIQAAIDEVAKRTPDSKGMRGAILLKKGTYKIAGTIRITTSGIVLRGEGDETKLIATGKGQRSLIAVTGTGKITEIKDSRRQIRNKYVPVGAITFQVEDAHSFKRGDAVILYRPGTANWIHDLKMDSIEVRDSTSKQWQPKEYDLHFERKIAFIEHDWIVLDNPVVMAMDSKYGGGSIYKYTFEGRISNIGVENLLCESEFANDTDEDHGWSAVFFNRIENAWATNITSKYFGYSCINLGDQSKQITVNNCRSLDPKSQITGGRRYSFNNDGQLNLVMNCFASHGRHDYVTGARVCGPNVFYNCKSENAHADTGPHHRWAVGTLFDNIVSDGEINIQDRGNWGTGHGWAGGNQVLWNCTASKAVVQNPWVSANNYVIGLQGEKYSGRLPGRPDGIWEGQNKKGLKPQSLFLAQVQQRKKKF